MSEHDGNDAVLGESELERALAAGFGREATDGAESVLDSIRRRTGAAPQVTLGEADTGPEHLPPLATPADVSLPRGKRNYQLLGEIARGGMGAVLRAHDTDLGRDVALKVLHRGLEKDAAVLQRFVEEAQIGGQLQHPGVVPVYEVGLTADERPYFTMKLVKGRTLSALLRERERADADLRRYLSIFEQACQALAYAHSRGVLHRDLKPANVMVGAFGEVQIVDWGLAKVLRRGGVDDERRARRDDVSVITTVRSEPGSAGSHSRHGSVMGTPAYMAPEQARGEIQLVDERSDVFAMGAILCEILTGKPPYVGDDLLAQAATARLEEARARLEACGADRELVSIARRCLEVEPAARFASAESLANALAAYSQSVDERARRATIEAAEAKVRAVEAGKERKLALALAGVVLLASVGYLGWERERRARRESALSEVQVALEDGQRAHGSGDEETALACALRAQSLARAAGLDADVVARADKLASEATAAVESERRAAERRDRNARFLRELDRVRSLEHSELAEGTDSERSAVGPAVEIQRSVTTTQDWEARDRGLAAAFRELGIDFARQSDEEVLALVRESGIGTDVALGLDVWVAVARVVDGSASRRTTRFLALARGADLDRTRTEIREAIGALDRDALRRIAADPRFLEQSPITLYTLCAALTRAGASATALELCVAASRRYPQDFHLHTQAALLLHTEAERGDERRHVDALAHLYAALALRPDSRVAARLLPGVLTALERYGEAVEAARAARDLDPGHWLANVALVQALQRAGRSGEAAEAIRDAERLAPRDAHVQLEVANWRASSGDLDGALASARRSAELGGVDDEHALMLSEAITRRLIRGGRADEAVALARAFVGDGVWGVAAHEALVELLVRSGRRDDATTELRVAFANAEKLLADAAVRDQVTATWVLLTQLAFELGLHDEGGRWLEQIRPLAEASPRAGTLAGLAALLHNQARESDRALELFDRALELAPKDGMVHYNRAMVLSSLGRTADALAALEQAMACEPSRTAHWQAFVGIAWRGGERERAVEMVEQHCGDRGLGLWMRLTAIEYLKALGRLDEAREHVRRIAALAPRWTETRPVVAQSAVEFASAPMVPRTASEPRALAALAMFALNLELETEAEILVSEALRLGPSDAWAQCESARVMLALTDDARAALPACERALTLDPGLPSARHFHAALLTLLQRVEEAHAEAKAALAAHWARPDEGIDLGDTCSLLAWSGSKLGQRDEVRRFFEQEFEAHPNEAHLPLILAGIAADEGDIEWALAWYRRLPGLSSWHARKLVLLGAWFVGANHAAEGLDCLRRATALAPEDSDVWRRAAESLLVVGQDDEALAAYKHASDLEPRDVELLRRIAACLENSSRAPEALEYYLRAVQLRPTDVELLVYLSQQLDFAGRYDEAYACYRNILALEPDNGFAHVNLAWGLAMCPRRELRDPKAALVHARKTVELGPHEENNWDNLIVAHYANEDYASAREALAETNQRFGESSLRGLMHALIQERSGEHEAARQTLARVRGELAEMVRASPELQVLVDEAEATIPR